MVIYNKCKSCGQDFPIYDKEQEYIKEKQFDMPTRCRKCREKLKGIHPTIFTCKDCGKEFRLTNKEYNFYTSRNLEIPKRCKSCAIIKKKFNENEKKKELSNNG